MEGRGVGGSGHVRINHPGIPRVGRSVVSRGHEIFPAGRSVGVHRMIPCAVAAPYSAIGAAAERVDEFEPILVERQSAARVEIALVEDGKAGAIDIAAATGSAG